MRQTAAVGVIKKDILLPKPDHILAAAATPFSQLFNGADPESRAPARLEVGSTSAFTFNPPATPTPFVSVPGTPVFIFGATEAASAPLDPLPRPAHQQHFRQPSIDELYEADLHSGRRSSPRALHAPSIRQRSLGKDIDSRTQRHSRFPRRLFCRFVTLLISRTRFRCSSATPAACSSLVQPMISPSTRNLSDWASSLLFEGTLHTRPLSTPRIMRRAGGLGRTATGTALSFG